MYRIVIDVDRKDGPHGWVEDPDLWSAKIEGADSLDEIVASTTEDLVHTKRTGPLEFTLADVDDEIQGLVTPEELIDFVNGVKASVMGSDLKCDSLPELMVALAIRVMFDAYGVEPATTVKDMLMFMAPFDPMGP